jgi:hypothetical protein
MEQLCLLYHEKTQEANEKCEAVLKCRQQLYDRFLQLQQRRSDLEAKYIACAELHGNVKADGNDTIRLNVGGVGVVVKRSVLTLFPDSKLAVLFSGRWDKKLLRDKKNSIFLDVDPVCFQVILDYLTQCSELPGDAPSPSLPEVSEELKTTFDFLCTFFKIVFTADTFSPKKVAKSKHIQTAVCGGESVEDSCDALKAVLKEERSILDSMEQALEEEESSFFGEEMFVTSFAGGETKDIVQLNVSGGEVMSVRRSTLRLCEGSVLYHQFDDTAWCQGKKRKRESEAGIESDNDDDVAGVLIDQPPYSFGKLINQLRLKAIMPPGVKVPRSYITEQEITNFEAVVQYYFPGQEEFILPEILASFASDILAEEDHKLLLEGWVAESKPDLDTEVTLSLLYRGSRDGFGAADFHLKCDDKGATVTIVKSTEGNIFGGYSDQSWKSDNFYIDKSSSRAFLFSIVNPAGLAPMKLPLTGERNGNAVWCHPSWGPVFGGGRDLYIHDNWNTGKNSYSRLGSSYTLPPGQDKKTFLAGSEYFLVAEIEVFAVQQQQEE